MAARPPGCVSAGCSYTVLIVPLKTPLHAPDGLRLFHWLRRQKALEQEKDSLWGGAGVLEQTRLWYHRRLDHNRALQRHLVTRGAAADTSGRTQTGSCLLRSKIHRANGSLGSVMCEPNMSSTSAGSLPDALSDSDLRWQSTVLTQEVSEKNRRISMLELDKCFLLQQIGELKMQT